MSESPQQLEYGREVEPSNEDIVIYKGPHGKVDVRLARNTVWLRQENMAALFGRDRTVIGRHIRNVFSDGELDTKSNVRNLHIANSETAVCWTRTAKRFLTT